MSVPDEMGPPVVAAGDTPRARRPRVAATGAVLLVLALIGALIAAQGGDGDGVEEIPATTLPWSDSTTTSTTTTTSTPPVAPTVTLASHPS